LYYNAFESKNIGRSMPLNWYKSIIKKVKNYRNIIGEIEHNVLDENQRFRDIYERNVVLEREISERTEDLNQANQSLLTLKHIWSTMNSSEPLSEVLSTVVNGLSDELGYLFCSMFQIYENQDTPILKSRAINKSNFSSKIQNILQNPLDLFEIPLAESQNIIVQAVNDKKIKSVNNLKSIFYGINPVVDNEKLEKLNTLFVNRSTTILPIIVNEKPFGCLVVVSLRNTLTDTERNFLSLFVGQIELAVTIAGLFEQIREQAITDGLTGLYNRRYFDQCLASEVERALRLRQPFTLIILDLDHLKFINDTYGHPAGDAAICSIGKILKQNARSIDIPARYGGEEFAVILPGISLEGGEIAAERLRLTIEEESIDGVGTVTASIGVATFLNHTESLSELLELADQALYKAKRNGRNQVQIASREEEANWHILALDAFIDILTKRHVPISSTVASELIQKLKTTPVQESNLSGFLYFVVDSLAKTYSSMYEGGYTKQKVDIVSQLAKDVNLSEPEIDELILATLLHDLGNLMMPENILLKPGPLTEEEKQSVLEHPIVTAREILKPIQSASPIINMIEHYREHWDGSGYPGNLAGDNIPIGSRIISIVSVYFAMVSDRPYRKALCHEEAVKIIKEGAGSSWDENLVEIFVKIIQKESKPV
jgi:diguanylate cyclase (GGDEF)-like protein